MFNRVESSREKLSSSISEAKFLGFLLSVAFVVFKTPLCMGSVFVCGPAEPFKALFIGFFIDDMVLVVESLLCFVK